MELLEPILRLLTAVILGAAVGLQRERAHKPAGLRTHALIALGAAVFTVVSTVGFGLGTDPSRIAAGVVTGIGFLGAGVIFRGMRGDAVVRITTASSIWVTAAIGLAAGVGLYLIAIIVTVIVVIVLLLPKVHG